MVLEKTFQCNSRTLVMRIYPYYLMVQNLKFNLMVIIIPLKLLQCNIAIIFVHLSGGRMWY